MSPCAKTLSHEPGCEENGGMENGFRRRARTESDRAPAFDGSRPGVTPAASSSQVPPRHRLHTGYRCSLSGLAGFTRAPLRGTQPSTLLTGVRPQTVRPPAGIQPGYGGLPVQGTASPPLSTVTLLFYPVRPLSGKKASQTRSASVSIPGTAQGRSPYLATEAPAKLNWPEKGPPRHCWDGLALLSLNCPLFLVEEPSGWIADEVLRA